MDDVLLWYNGYQIGDYRLINPWSFSTWLDEGREVGSYWIGMAEIESFNDVLEPHMSSVLKETVELSFADGYGKLISGFTSVIRYDTGRLTPPSIWNLLILSGYLSYLPSSASDEGYAFIPNLELLLHWRKVISQLLAQKIASGELSDSIVNALRFFDTEKLPGLFDRLIMSVSHFNLTREVCYHMLCHGLFFGIFLHNRNSVVVSSDREAGHGRYDLIVKFMDLKKAIIIEFKKSSSEENLGKDAQIGLNQIISMKYMSGNPGFTFLLIGVSFYGKHVSPLKTQIVDSCP